MEGELQNISAYFGDIWGSPEQAAESQLPHKQLEGVKTKMYQIFANGLQYIGSTTT